MEGKTVIEALGHELLEVGYGHGCCRRVEKNDYIAEALKKYPDRFVRGLGVVNPRHGKTSVPEVDRIFGDLGLHGLLFSNDKTGLTFDNPVMGEYFEHTMQYPNPVVFAYTSQYSVLQAPFMLEKMARRFPGIKFINGHKRGDQIIHFNVTIPRSLNEKQKQLIRDMDAAMPKQTAKKGFFDL